VLESPLLHKPAVFATKQHPVWQEIAAHFKPSEFTSPYEMDAEFLRLLFQIRKRTGKVPMRIISDARPPDKDIGASKSAHKKRPCRAVDLKVRNAYERAVVLLAALACGIVRAGVYPGSDGDGGGLHLDAETSADNPSPRIWTKY
jgi:hypothetical protein